VLLGRRKHDSPKKIVKVEKKDVGEVALQLVVKTSDSTLILTKLTIFPLAFL
jgi:hypothetical protein